MLVIWLLWWLRWCWNTVLFRRAPPSSGRIVLRITIAYLYHTPPLYGMVRRFRNSKWGYRQEISSRRIREVTLYSMELQNSYCISQIEMSVTKNAKLAFHPHKLGRHAASAYTVCLRLWVKHAAETSISGFLRRQVTRREAAASGKINFLSHKTSCPRADRDTAKTNYNICTTSDQRRRRWADVVQMLYKIFCAC